MADAASLKLIGFLLGSVTAAVMLMAAMIVSGSMTSSQALDGPQFGYYETTAEQ